MMGDLAVFSNPGAWIPLWIALSVGLGAAWWAFCEIARYFNVGDTVTTQTVAERHSALEAKLAYEQRLIEATLKRHPAGRHR